MGNGKWTRYGRGDCEGYSLDVGNGYMRFNSGVSSNGKTWWANINGHKLGGEYGSKEEAQSAIEGELRMAMQAVLEDWVYYCAQKPIPPVRVLPSAG